MRRNPSHRSGAACALRRSQWLVGTILLWLWSGPQAYGLQRPLKTRLANYEESPVILRNVSVKLVETFSGPTQFPFAAFPDGAEVRVRRNQVRYMNQLNHQIPTYLLEGQLELRNEASKEVAAFQLTTVFLNAFRERIGTDRHTLSGPLAPRQTTLLSWSRNLPHEEVFEMFFAVTAIRFADGTVWTPTEELILLP